MGDDVLADRAEQHAAEAAVAAGPDDEQVRALGGVQQGRRRVPLDDVPVDGPGAAQDPLERALLDGPGVLRPVEVGDHHAPLVGAGGHDPGGDDVQLVAAEPRLPVRPAQRLPGRGRSVHPDDDPAGLLAGGHAVLLVLAGAPGVLRG